MRYRSIAAVVALVVLGAGLFGGVAGSQTTQRRTAIVALGDSYISGEAAGEYAEGTDTATNSCHRSARSLIHVAAAASADVAFNLACSGATTTELRAGGVARFGEVAQLDALREIAQSYDIRTVVVSIGGNDLGFGEIIRDCLASYLPFVADCAPGINARLPQRLDEVAPQVGGVLDDVRAVLDDGRPTGDDGLWPTDGLAGRVARFLQRDDGAPAADIVLLSYPSPVTEDIRTPWLRLAIGCPFTLDDLGFARAGLTRSVAATWAQVAAAHQARFLDLSRAFDGHEVCAKGATPTSEWATGIYVDTAQLRRGIGANLIAQSLHPNAAGHAQIGRCLSRFRVLAAPSARCLADAQAGGALDAVVG